MSDAAPFPMIHSEILGNVVLRADIAQPDEPPWISDVPEELWPPRNAHDRIEIYLAGDSSRPDPSCLALAEHAALNLHRLVAICQPTLAPHFESPSEQESWLMWLQFPHLQSSQDRGKWEAVFTFGSANDSFNDIYSLWIVTLQDEEPQSVRREYW